MKRSRNKVRGARLAPYLLPALFVSTFGACLVDFEEFDFGSLNAGAGGGGSGPGPGSGGTGGTIFPAGGNGGVGGMGPGPGGMGPGPGGMGPGPGGMGPGPGGSGGMGQGGGGTVSVACGNQTCDVTAGQICCVPLGMPTQANCQTGPNCAGATEGELSCDEPADCPGQICCGTFQGGGYTQAQCQATCNGGGSVIICDGNGDCNGNDTCDQSNFLPTGYGVCT